MILLRTPLKAHLTAPKQAARLYDYGIDRYQLIEHIEVVMCNSLAT